MDFTSEQRLLASIGVPLITDYITIGPYSIRYIKAGKGYPLILLHGGNIGIGQWYPNIKELSKKYTVYALDLPGAGRSTRINYSRLDIEHDFVDTVRQFILKKKLKRPHLVGSSIGGWISLKLSFEMGEQLGKLVLVDTIGFMNSSRISDKITGFYPFAVFLSKGPLRPVRNNKAIEAFLRDVFYNKQLDISKEFIDYFYGTMETSHNLLLISKLSSIKGMRKELILIDELSRVNNPVMVIWGQHDKQMPLERNEPNFKRLGNLKKVVVIKDAGHIPSIEKSEEFNRTIMKFL